MSDISNRTQMLDKSDDKTVNAVLSALNESENGMSCVIDENTANVQLVGNRRYVIIQDFD